MTTKIEDLEQKIRNRANQQVQQAIRDFRNAIASALSDLLGGSGDMYQVRGGNTLSSNGFPRAVLANMLSDDPRNGWPSNVWRNRENALRKVILDKMDELQRITLAKPPGEDEDAEAKPEEDSDGATE